MESAVSGIINIANSAVPGLEYSKSSEDNRAVVREKLESLVFSLQTDETSWENVKTKYLYDIYLEMRKAEGTITNFDMVRPKLVMAQFSNSDEYHLHCLRMSDFKTENPSDLSTKTCSKCGKEKDIKKFKHRGGSVCNACACASYRTKKKEA